MRRSTYFHSNGVLQWANRNSSNFSHPGPKSFSEQETSFTTKPQVAVKEFHEIPGPKALPFVGTLWRYLPLLEVFHPAYSPDMIPPELDMFPKLKESMWSVNIFVVGSLNTVMNTVTLLQRHIEEIITLTNSAQADSCRLLYDTPGTLITTMSI
uniref:Uncharacterized protein n=1 Tax=Timema cristinae TaxID=61476 RepID=A0A7R9CEF1_TIMCR|nr:unnamed protein product [Timema cristinae]